MEVRVAPEMMKTTRTCPGEAVLNTQDLHKKSDILVTRDRFDTGSQTDMCSTTIDWWSTL